MKRNKYISRLDCYNYPKNFGICKSGTGIEPIYEYIKDEKTGYLVKIKTGETNIKEYIQQCARNSSITLLMAQIKNGERKPHEGVYSESNMIPSNMVDARKNYLKIADCYDDNKLLQDIYPSKDAFLYAINQKVDLKQVIDDYNKKVISSYEKFNAKKVEKPIENKEVK